MMTDGGYMKMEIIQKYHFSVIYTSPKVTEVRTQLITNTQCLILSKSTKKTLLREE